MAKRLIPLFNRVLVEKIVPPSKTNAGILLPEKSSKLNSGKVIAAGPGIHTKDGKLIPVAVKEGDTVLLPEYGGTEVKLDNKEYIIFTPVQFFILIIKFNIVDPFSNPLKLRDECGKLTDKISRSRYHLYRDDDILGTLHD
ncbi:10 kDa chaperonin, mitochondrial [Mucuna pruriens]|uniref:Protein groES n=1 Tax=Mucuna pruriens TaxID=157652 RepID=A0A371EE60_MUCPR|nr:10 kDa chaperonin, mitochondrial [Mucuna pruriens]